MVRASSLDRILSCPASYHAPTVDRIEAPDEAARLGTATHRVMLPIVTRAPELDVRQIADEHHVDREELEILRAIGKRMWDAIKGHFGTPICEQQLTEYGDLQLTGHPDVMDCIDGRVLVVDWKTGHAEGAHANQLRAYAFLACLYYRSLGVEVKSAWVAVLRVRTQEIIPAEYTWDELQRWYAGAVSRLEGESVYRPSPETCQYCPRRFECPARLTMMRDALGVLIDLDASETGMELGDWLPEQLRHGVVSARAIGKLCDQFLELAKTEVKIRGGVPGLEVVPQERREYTPEAWPLIEERIGLPVLRGCCRISKTKVEDAVSKAAPKGRKGAAVKEFNADLEAAGVVSVKVVEKLEVRQVERELSQES